MNIIRNTSSIFMSSLQSGWTIDAHFFRFASPLLLRYHLNCEHWTYWNCIWLFHLIYTAFFYIYLIFIHIDTLLRFTYNHFYVHFLPQGFRAFSSIFHGHTREKKTHTPNRVRSDTFYVNNRFTRKGTSSSLTFLDRTKYYLLPDVLQTHVEFSRFH